MLLDYHSNYTPEPGPEPTPAWMPPLRRVREPERVRREREPEPERQIVVGTMDLTLPMLRVEVVASASTIPPTPITAIDLDAHEDGWTDERLLMAAMQALLDDEDD